ncbi:MAG: hypothetical protein C6Y22_10625 [Hapalosiphonaceae cyanobacterium JJU2]|nr:MAG: hypothetical protein C6Y22_10625 [Hapalosiphonaceae cyanobacterium JJU2]
MAKTKNLQILFFVFLILNLLSDSQQRSFAVLNTNYRGDLRNQVKYSPWGLEVAPTATKPACVDSNTLYSVESKSIKSDSVCITANYIRSEFLIHSVNSTIALNDTKAPQNLNQEFNKFKETNKKFDASVNEFINQLEQVLNGTKIRRTVSSKNALSQLEALDKLNQSLNAKIKVFDKFSNDIKVNSNNINSYISSDLEQIRAILTPLQFGLNREAISQVQEELKITSDGSFGRVTLGKIKENLKTNNERINSQIIELEKLVDPQNTKLTTSSEDTPSTNSASNSQNNNLNENIIFFLLGVAPGIAIGALLMLLYQNTKKNSQAIPNTTDNNTSIYALETAKHTICDTEQQEQHPNTQTNNSESDSTITSSTESSETFTQPPTSDPPPTNPQPNTQRNFSSSKSQIIQTYNRNPKSLNKDATEVSETTDSINQRRLGGHQSVTLEKVSKGKGNYWILPEQGFLCLVPKGNLKINEYNYETVATLFDCYNYQSGYSNDFQLITPATVISVGQDQWELRERGELKF